MFRMFIKMLLATKIDPKLAPKMGYSRYEAETWQDP